MFAANSYPYNNYNNALLGGGIGPMLRHRLEEKRALKEATQFKINKLDTQLRKMLSAAASKSRRRDTIEELDARMAQLEKQRTISSLKLADEKKILREIEALERMKKNEIEISQIRNDLNTYRDIVHETNDAISELESALIKVNLADRLGCSMTELQEETITCPGSKLAHVIGKNGSNISNIERRTGVQMEVADTKPGEDGRIRIVGTGPAIAEAITEIENVTLAVEEDVKISPVLSAFLSSKRYAALEKTRANCPSVYIDLTANTIRLRGRPEKVAEAKADILSYDCKKETIIISIKEVGLIVGKGGSNVQKLEKDNDVAINVDANEAKGIATVDIVGTASDVDATCTYLKDLIYEHEEVEDYIICTPAQRNMFLENTAAVLKEVQAQISEQGDRCLIVFDKRDDEDSNKTQSKLMMKATRSVLPTVRRLVQERIDAYEAGVVTVIVDPSIIPAIIGKGGETIRALEKEGVGATVDIDKDKSAVVVYSSDLETRLAVVEKINEIIANNQTERIPIDRHMIGQLLGEPGKDVRKEISDGIGAWMAMDDNDTCLLVRGNKEKIAQSALLLENFFRDNYHIEFDVAADYEQLLFAGGQDCILSVVEREHSVRANFIRATSKVVIRGREENAKKSKEAIETSIYGGEGYAVSRVPVPEKFKGVVLGKNGSNLTKLETDHTVSATLIRSSNDLVLRGAPEDVMNCRAAVFKLLATVNVTETVPITRFQYGELSKDNNMRTITEGLNASATLETESLKLRGIEADVKEAKARIVEKFTGKYVTTIPLDDIQLAKLQKAASEKFSQIGESTKAALSLDAEDCAIKIEGKRANVKKAKFTLFKFLDFMLPSQFAKVTIPKQNMKTVGDPACLADVAAETGTYLWLDRDLSCVHIRSSDAKSVAAAVKLLGEKKDDSYNHMIVIQLEPHEDWLVPKILGKGGSVINNIRKTSGSKIDLSREDLTLTITGGEDERAKAKLMLDEIIVKARKECAMLVIPGDAMTPFIGKGGAHIRKMQEENNVAIDCERERSALRITGEESAVEKAVEAVKSWITEWEEENSSKTILVKDSMLSAIVGKGGSVINAIQQETGCKVSIDRAASSVTIRGLARELAAEKIQTIIENEIREATARAAEKERLLKEAQAAAEAERLRQAEEQAKEVVLELSSSNGDSDKKAEVVTLYPSVPVGMKESSNGRGKNGDSEDFLKPDPYVTEAGPELLAFLLNDSPNYDSEIIESLFSIDDISAFSAVPTTISGDSQTGAYYKSTSGVSVRL